MVNFDTTLQIFEYVTSGNYFWLNMGFATATAMFIGAVIYKDNLRLMYKGIITVLVYIFFLFSTIINRLAGLQNIDFIRGYASIVTIFLLSFFYLIGIIGGALIISKTIKK